MEKDRREKREEEKKTSWFEFITARAKFLEPMIFYAAAVKCAEGCDVIS